MKKRVIALLFILIASMALFAACGGNVLDSTTDITGIAFTDAEYEYDGEEKTLLIIGTLPEGVTASYTNNKGTEPGTYNATVVISGNGYNTLTLSAKLMITVDENDIIISGISFEDKEEVYDGQEKSIVVSGDIPQGIEVSYLTNKATDAGVYSAKATLNGDGYRTLVLSATLTINKAEISGVTFTDQTYKYDGKEKTLLLEGNLPSGVSATYTTNKGTNAGIYTSSVKLEGANYKALTLNADLIISKADITDIALNGGSVEYDTFEHSIQIVGNVPSGVATVYTYNGEQVDFVIEAGTYNVVATLSGPNHNTLTLNAQLKITASEELLHSMVYSGNVYFQNNLDDNKLYKVNTSGTELNKVSNDIANYFVNHNNKLHFHSKGLLSSSIAALDGSSVDKKYTVNADYLASDGTNLYYAISNIVNYKNTNGIYKVDLNDDDVIPVKLTNDKASHLVYDNGYIYYVNLSNDDKISKISASADEGISSVVIDRKSEELVINGGVLYYTAKDGAINWKIFKYIISSGEETELTTNRGKYLTVTGSNIYYVNIDLLTSTLFGKGIYKTPITGFGITEKIIESENNGYSSLTSDGNNLYFYKLNDKHFYRYNLSTKTETDLMGTFVPVEDTSITGYTQITEYNGELYYINPLDDGSVYKYNITTKAKYKVLAERVANFYFYDNYIYYSTFNIAKNYALFRLDLETNESVKIATHRTDNLIFVGDYIYYSRVKVVGSNNSLMRMDLDGSNQTELFKGENIYVTSLEYKDGKIYFCSNPVFGSKTLYVYDIASNTASSLSVNAEICLLYENDIYYYYNKQLNKISSSGGATMTLSIEPQADLTFIYAKDGVIYYSATKNSAEALYAFNIATGVNTKLADGPASAIYKNGNTLYYIKAKTTYSLDYPVTSGDGHLYSIDLNTKAETKIA